MAKRSADELQQGDSKRQRNSTDTLLSLVDHADELIDCLQKLKQQHRQIHTHPADAAVSQTRQQLKHLSKKLLPSLQSLASDNDFDVENSQNNAPDHSTASSQKGVSQITHPVPSVPHMSSPWISSEIPSSQPSLPKILDPTLESTVFTHPGISQFSNYERLEWLGDAYLELIASALIFQTFGHLSSGRNSQIREQLVRNTTLASYFRAYNLPSKAKLPRELGNGKALGRGRSSDKDLLKTQSDMFEAYVAAAIISDPKNGLGNTVEWLRTLWGQTIRDQIAAAEKKSKDEVASGTVGKVSPPKERLAQSIAARGVQLQYKDINSNKRDPNLNLPLFTVGVYLTGWGERDKLLGTGTALSKSEAGQKAADVALQNKKQMQVYVERKRVFLEAQKASQEAQDTKQLD